MVGYDGTKQKVSMRLCAACACGVLESRVSTERSHAIIKITARSERTVAVILIHL